MEKINHLKQLRDEHHRLEEHQAELENRIKDDWKQLKEGLKPRNAGRSIYNRWKKWNERSPVAAKLVAGVVLAGTALLVGVVINKTTHMLGRLFRKKQRYRLEINEKQVA